MSGAIETRVLSTGRLFTQIAVTEARRNREPLRTEVLMNRKTDSYYCRACRDDACRHAAAARRCVRRRHLTVIAGESPAAVSPEERPDG